MRLTFTTFLLLLATGISFSQNIKFEAEDIYYYRYPMKPLDKSAKHTPVGVVGEENQRGRWEDMQYYSTLFICN